MSTYYYQQMDPETGEYSNKRVDSAELGQMYLKAIHQLKQDHPERLSNARDVIDLAFMNSSRGDYLLNPEARTDVEFKNTKILDAERMAYSGQIDKMNDYFNDYGSLQDPRLAVAAYLVDSRDKLDDNQKKQAMVNVADFLDTGKQNFDEIADEVSIGDSADMYLNEYRDIAQQEFALNRYELYQKTPVSLSDAKKDALTDFVTGLRDGNQEMDDMIEDDYGNVPDPLGNLGDRSAFYKVGKLYGQQVDGQVRGYEGVEFLHLPKYHNVDVGPDDLRDDPEQALMNHDELKIVKHAALNQAYDEMKTSLSHMSDDAFDDEKTGGIDAAISNLDDERLHETLAMDEAITLIDDEGIDMTQAWEPDKLSSHMENEYGRAESGKQLPSEIRELVDACIDRKPEGLQNSEFISAKDKKLLREGSKPSMEEVLDAKQDPDKAAELNREYKEVTHNYSVGDLDLDKLMKDASQKYDPNVAQYDDFQASHVAEVMEREWTANGRPVKINEDRTVEVDPDDFKPYDGELNDDIKAAFNQQTEDMRKSVEQLVSKSDDKYFEEQRQQYNTRYNNAADMMMAGRNADKDNQTLNSVDHTYEVGKMIDYLENDPDDVVAHGGDTLTQNETKKLFDYGVERGLASKEQYGDVAINESTLSEAIRDYGETNHDADILRDVQNDGSRGANEVDTIAYGIVVGAKTADIDHRDRDQYVANEWNKLDEFNFDSRTARDFMGVLDIADQVHDLKAGVVPYSESEIKEMIPEEKHKATQEMLNAKQKPEMGGKMDSMIHGINLNKKMEREDVGLTPKEMQHEVEEQQLQHDEDNHKENVKVAKHKQQKTNDGPEM